MQQDEEGIIDQKEKILLEYLLGDRESFVKVIRIIKPEYFEEPLDRVVKFIIKYFNEHFDIPTTRLIRAETGITLDDVELSAGERSYFLEEIEKHCRTAAMRNAVLESVDFVNNGDLEPIEALIREPLLIRLDNSVGTNLTHDVEQRIKDTYINLEYSSTGLNSYDDLIGKVARGSCNFVFAVSAGGKSLFLGNIAHLFAKQKKNVYIISIELNEDLYSKRLDAIVTGVDIDKHEDSVADIVEGYDNLDEMGNITVKRVPYKTTPSNVRSMLMEYHITYGFFPDVLIVDYMHLMGSDNVGKSEQSFTQHEDIAFSLKDIFEEFNLYGWSAGQLRREAYDVLKVNSSHVAGGISVINASDSSIALVASEEDVENDQVQMQQLKIRSAKKVTYGRTLYKDPRTLRFSDIPNNNVKNLPTPVKSKQSSKASDIDDAKGKKKLAGALKM